MRRIQHNGRFSPLVVIKLAKKPEMRRGNQIELDNGVGEGFLAQLAELFLMGMTTADHSTIK